VPISKRRQASLTATVDTPESVRHSQFPVAGEILQQHSSGRFEHGANRACAGDRDTELTPLSL
jgi:hypothetical protein